LLLEHHLDFGESLLSSPETNARKAGVREGSDGLDRVRVFVGCLSQIGNRLLDQLAERIGRHGADYPADDRPAPLPPSPPSGVFTGRRDKVTGGGGISIAVGRPQL
jgi:hypothetical protein